MRGDEEGGGEGGARDAVGGGVGGGPQRLEVEGGGEDEEARVEARDGVEADAGAERDREEAEHEELEAGRAPEEVPDEEVEDGGGLAGEHDGASGEGRARRGADGRAAGEEAGGGAGFRRGLGLGLARGRLRAAGLWARGRGHEAVAREAEAEALARHVDVEAGHVRKCGLFYSRASDVGVYTGAAGPSMNVGDASEAGLDLHDELVFMLRNDAHVRGSLSRLQNSCVNVTMQWQEGGNDLVAPLDRHMRTHFNLFLRQAVELCMYCGFVPFYIERVRGVATPVVLPPGAFMWSTEFADAERKREAARGRAPWMRQGGAGADAKAAPAPTEGGADAEGAPDLQLEFQRGVLVYRVRPKGGCPVDAKKIYIFPWMAPTAYTARANVYQRLHSPLSGLLRLYVMREQVRQQITEATMWNSQKHICLSENVDLKDQTTTGIQLLDELRRYKLTGAHAGVRDGVRMRSRQNADISNVNEGQFQWIHSEFNAETTPGAQVHILPPNHDVTELAPIPHSEAMQYADEAFSRAVAAFFDVPTQDGSRQDRTAASVEQTSKTQYEVIMNMTRFLGQLGEEAYARCFKVPSGRVQLTITPTPRVDLTGAGDVKDLLEAGVFKDYDKSKLRKRYHTDY